MTISVPKSEQATPSRRSRNVFTSIRPERCGAQDERRNDSSVAASRTAAATAATAGRLATAQKLAEEVPEVKEAAGHIVQAAELLKLRPHVRLLSVHQAPFLIRAIVDR